MSTNTFLFSNKYLSSTSRKQLCIYNSHKSNTSNPNPKCEENACNNSNKIAKNPKHTLTS